MNVEGGQSRATTVFVSYSRDDRKRVLPLIQALEVAGHAVWWDGLLEGGERFAKTTAHALDTARAVVVVWSKTSIGSHWVHDEATVGRDRKSLVPLSLDGSEPPLGFRQFQVIDISRSRMKPGDAAHDAVLRAVAALHEGAVVAAPTKRAAPDRRILMAGGGALAAAGVAGLYWWRGSTPAAQRAAGPSDNSIAVLPFANLSADPEQSYFSEGLAAEVRGVLARNPRLEVAAQASSNRFRTRAEDARTMALQLGVAYLLDGNVRRAGNLVRIAAELIDGASGFSKWSQSFERPITDVFAVQDEIAAAVATALSAKLGTAATGSAAREIGGTSSVEAYDNFLRGSELFARGTNEATDRAALERFDAAIAIDADYGAAHAAQSRNLAVIANLYDKTGNRPATYAKAISAAQRAVSLAPQLADAYSALGYVMLYGELDAKAARAPFERSAQLGKGDASVLARYALFCGETGRFSEARTAIARATRLDPLNARVFRISGDVAYSARDYAAAITALQNSLQLDSTTGRVHFAKGAAWLGRNDLAAAEAEFRAETSSLFALTGLAITFQRQERTAAAKIAFARLVAEFGDIALYQQSQVLAQWHDIERAMTALKEALAKRDAGIMSLRNDPFLDPVRSAPGFSQLLTSLGLG